MKLKKIASLALAGVMAVSMLAGCAGKTSTTEDGTTVTVTATGAAAAAEEFNGAQDTVKFTAGVSLQNALEEAVKSFGVNSAEGLNGNVGQFIYATTGVDYVADFVYTGADAANVDTILVVKRYGSSSNGVWSEQAAVVNAVSALKSEVADCKDTTFVKNQTAAGATYYDYTYAGEVAVASATTGEGTTAYYVAFTITRTPTEQTFNK